MAIDKHKWHIECQGDTCIKIYKLFYKGTNTSATRGNQGDLMTGNHTHVGVNRKGKGIVGKGHQGVYVSVPQMEPRSTRRKIVHDIPYSGSPT